MLDPVSLPQRYAPNDAELDALMEQIRAELAARRQAAAAGALAREAQPRHFGDFAALPEDAFLEAAARAAFGRSLTAEEMSRANWDLRAGTTRALFLARLLAQPEARARGARIPGVTRAAALDRFRHVLAHSGLKHRLRPVLRLLRGFKRLIHAAPRLVRLDETLAATRQAAVAEQTRRFASFAQQQAQAQAALEARIAALEARPAEMSVTLARAMAAAARDLAAPPGALVSLLREAPGPVLDGDAIMAPARSGRLIEAGIAAVLVEEELLTALRQRAAESLGAIVVPSGILLGELDAVLAEAARTLAPGGFCILPPPGPALGSWAAAAPAAAAPPALLRRLTEQHGLVFEASPEGVPLARRPR